MSRIEEKLGSLSSIEERLRSLEEKPVTLTAPLQEGKSLAEKPPVEKTTKSILDQEFVPSMVEVQGEVNVEVPSSEASGVGEAMKSLRRLRAEKKG